jgi:hypothetical protein
VAAINNMINPSLISINQISRHPVNQNLHYYYYYTRNGYLNTLLAKWFDGGRHPNIIEQSPLAPYSLSLISDIPRTRVLAYSEDLNSFDDVSQMA